MLGYVYVKKVLFGRFECMYVCMYVLYVCMYVCMLYLTIRSAAFFLESRMSFPFSSENCFLCNCMYMWVLI